MWMGWRGMDEGRVIWWACRPRQQAGIDRMMEGGMAIRVRDPRLRDVLDEGEALTELAAGFQFTEGPAWHPREGHLTFSDIPGDRLHRWSEAQGVLPFRAPSNKANGNTYDRRGRLLTCEHATSRVTRTEPDGAVRVLASHFQGKALNSPNDIVVRRDGTIWFTDPTYGRADRVGMARPLELDFRAVYRMGPNGEDLTPMRRDFDMPNGLAFSPDERHLYVADTPRMHVRRFEVGADGALTGGDEFATPTGDGAGAPDGLKTDSAGHVFCAGPGGVHVFHPADGACLGVIETPAFCANFTWGGEDLRDFFLTASTCLYRMRVKVPGIPLF